MDCAIGLCGSDFVLLITDMTAARSIQVFKHDEDKISQLDTRQLLACAAEQSSRVEFSEYIEKNFALLKLRTGKSLSNHAAANFIRTQVAEALRSRGAYKANCLFGSYDDREGPALYHLDYLGSLQKVPFSAHGYGSYFALSILDSKHRENLSIDQGVELAKECCDQLARRFLINLPKFKLKLITATGVQEEEYRTNFKQSV